MYYVGTTYDDMVYYTADVVHLFSPDRRTVRVCIFIESMCLEVNNLLMYRCDEWNAHINLYCKLFCICAFNFTSRAHAWYRRTEKPHFLPTCVQKTFLILNLWNCNLPSTFFTLLNFYLLEILPIQIQRGIITISFRGKWTSSEIYKPIKFCRSFIRRITRMNGNNRYAAYVSITISNCLEEDGHGWPHWIECECRRTRNANSELVIIGLVCDKLTNKKWCNCFQAWL